MLPRTIADRIAAKIAAPQDDSCTAGSVLLSESDIAAIQEAKPEIIANPPNYNKNLGGVLKNFPPSNAPTC